jgi:hypothetical protein
VCVLVHGLFADELRRSPDDRSQISESRQRRHIEARIAPTKTVIRRSVST